MRFAGQHIWSSLSFAVLRNTDPVTVILNAKIIANFMQNYFVALYNAHAVSLDIAIPE